MTPRSVTDMLFTRPARARLERCALALLACLVLAGAGCWSSAGAAPEASSEYQVKAAFIYNFLKFVDWPADGLSSSTTICLGVLGRDPFDDALGMMKGKSAKGRKVVVVHFRSIEEVKGCDLLFVCASEKGHLAQILKSARNTRMLTVADQGGFCESGGMINLVFIKNRVGFEVNVAAATRARLRISSQLLKLARNVSE
jgi:hypothetical protein